MSSELNLDKRLAAFWVQLTMSRENAERRRICSQQNVNDKEKDWSFRMLHFRSLQLCLASLTLLRTAEECLVGKLRGWDLSDEEEKNTWLKDHVKDLADRSGLAADLLLDAMVSVAEAILADANHKYALSFETTTDRTFT
ncbi:MAG: hypothetical protein K2W82_16820 [Candidatus Obscuribacterales bacterium]|nr:hypothetical protein [Candidatus Obscuribacterales bacterium]